MARGFSFSLPSWFVPCGLVPAAPCLLLLFALVGDALMVSKPGVDISADAMPATGEQVLAAAAAWPPNIVAWAVDAASSAAAAATQALRSEPVRRRLSVGRVGWLHVPKTGTTFVNVLLTWACPRLPDDAAADERYVDETHFTMVAGFLAEYGADCPEELDLCRGHHVVGEECLAMPERHGQLVGMFRRPSQRILSGYYARLNMTSNGYEPAPYAHLVEGCATRMLLGIPCAEYSHGSVPLESQKPLPESAVTQALTVLDKEFAFVGITEHWPLSVCLFHAMFGGRCHRREFHNSRQGDRRSHDELYDESVLGNWTDPVDGPLYDRAYAIFWQNMWIYRVNQDRCRETICADVPDAFMDSQ